MSKESRLINKMNPKVKGIASEMILPNTSGDHVRSIKRQTPIDDADLVNKKYVDDEVAGAGGGSDGSDHDIVDHDTTATGAELDTLSDNSMADALHRHSELSASDGSPDAVVQVDASGRVRISRDFIVDTDLLFVDIAGNVGVGIGTATPSEMLDVVGNAEINGNIIVTGTVDGVDIAARDHAEAHTVVSHSDTTGTGTELDELTDGSETTLHSHAAAGGGFDSRMRYTRGSQQAITNASWTIVQFNTKVFDGLDEFDIDPWKFVATDAGYYFVVVSLLVSSAPWVTGETFAMSLEKNGATYSYIGEDRMQTNGTYYVRVSGSDVIYLGAGEYIDIRVFQNSGATVYIHNSNYYNYFAVQRLS